MTAYRLQFVPGGIIPPDVRVGVRMSPVVEAAEPVEPITTVITIDCPDRIIFGAGHNLFSAATEIPLGEYDEARSAYTYTKNFTGYTSSFGASFYRPAWWKILVPPGTKVYATLDTQLSFALNPATNPRDTKLYVLFAPTASTARDDLEQIAFSDDNEPDTGGINTAGGYFSYRSYVLLDGDRSGELVGSWFYFEVVEYGSGQVPIGLILRLSLTATPPGTMPADAHDPSA